MNVFLMITLLTFIDGNVSYREEAVVLQLNDTATLEYCQEHIAPYHERTIQVDERIVYKEIAECYKQE